MPRPSTSFNFNAIPYFNIVIWFQFKYCKHTYVEGDRNENLADAECDFLASVNKEPTSPARACRRRAQRRLVLLAKEKRQSVPFIPHECFAARPGLADLDWPRAVGQWNCSCWRVRASV